MRLVRKVFLQELPAMCDGDFDCGTNIVFTIILLSMISVDIMQIRNKK